MSTVLGSIRNKVKVKLPKSGGTVWMWDEVLAGDYRQSIGDGDVTKPTAANSFRILAKLIADWDFVNEKGEKVPINENSLDLLPISDLTVLSEKLNKITENSSIDKDVKKNIKNSST